MRKVDLGAPPEVRRIARRLESAGFETWAVGGAVRDALRGDAPGDWDLTTAARPNEVQRLFRRTVPIGVEHGTVGVLGKDGHLYEVKSSYILQPGPAALTEGVRQVHAVLCGVVGLDVPDDVRPASPGPGGPPVPAAE